MKIRPMVYSHYNNRGIWFKGTKDKYWYLLSWNPLNWVKNLITGVAVIGFFPFKTKHIDQN